ncbi:hypothetical protein CHARACLAT_000482 [Characodon lateralis]|uniref:Uncharacterized protein n=1 Tax=Characodon lateralis TaxID=208331 RepID=A0ABU7CNC5_9TELE|nr:hypothetical protein [Characodon lateralis]
MFTCTTQQSPVHHTRMSEEDNIRFLKILCQKAGDSQPPGDDGEFPELRASLCDNQGCAHCCNVLLPA